MQLLMLCYQIYFCFLLVCSFCQWYHYSPIVDGRVSTHVKPITYSLSFLKKQTLELNFYKNNLYSCFFVAKKMLKTSVFYDMIVHILLHISCRCNLKIPLLATGSNDQSPLKQLAGTPTGHQGVQVSNRPPSSPR